MSQNFFQIIRPVHVHLKTDKVDLKKRPPWKNFFFHFFSIDSSSRHEKRCQMLQRLFWLFQCSKNPLCKSKKKTFWNWCKTTEDGRAFYYYSVNHQTGLQRNTFSKLSYILLIHRNVPQIMSFHLRYMMVS